MQSSYSHSSSTAPSDHDEIDIGRLLAALLDAKWFIFSVTSVFALIGVMYAQLSIPIYKADALLQIEKKSSSNLTSLLGEGSELFSSDASAEVEVEIIRSRMILGAAVDAFHLQYITQPIFFPIFGEGFARLQGEHAALSVSRFSAPEHRGSQSYTVTVANKTEGRYILHDEAGNEILTALVGQLAEKNGYQILVDSAQVPNDNFRFSVSMRSKFDAILALKSRLSVQEKNHGTGIVELSLTGQDPSKIKRILDFISESYLAQNVQRNSAEAEKSLRFLNQYLPKIKATLHTSEETLNEFRQKNESIDLSMEAKATLDMMVSLDAQLNELTFKESEISQKFTKDHPAYKSLLDKRATLRKEKERMEKQVQKLPRTQREVLRMRRDVEVNQQIYVHLLNKVQELNVIRAGTVGNVRIIDSAQAYTQPIKPKKSLLVVLSLILGLILGAMLALVRTAFNRGIGSSEEIEQQGLNVYATIPKAATHSRKSNGLLAHQNPADITVEALRSLRTNLYFAMMEAANRVVMITGPTPEVGKSFVAKNFAYVASEAGQKVLLIDADLRRGRIHHKFDEPAEQGLSEYLSGQIGSESLIRHTHYSGTDLITRGKIPPNPSELLMTSRFAKLLEEVEANYDLIIIDTPPVLAVTDASIIGRIAGTTMCIARFWKTTPKELSLCEQRLSRSGVEIRGVIFNALERKVGITQEYYSYQYKEK